ncbi:MAG TPA: hypothetical protein ENN39_09345 [Desulfonatronum sp.]|nr:hypothetical protein [Desulfonatronum sp.]
MLQCTTSEVTRRSFLRGAGASVAGLAAVGSVGLLLKNTAIAKQVAPSVLPYAKVDPDAAMARAYEGYSKGG